MRPKTTHFPRISIILALIIALALTFGQANHVWADAANSIHYVDPNGSNTSPYETWAKAADDIPSAISVATAGDTVIVRYSATAYTGNRVQMKDGVTVQAEDYVSLGRPVLATTVEFHDEYRDPTYDTVLDGFYIDGAGPSIRFKAGGTGCGNNTIVQNCIIYGGARAGIKVDGDSSTGIKRSILAPQILNCEISYKQYAAFRLMDGAGEASEAMIIRGNDIHHNGLSVNRGSGIFFDQGGGTGYVLIQDNDIHDNENKAGISWKASNYTVHITNNRIYNNGMAGIHVIEAITGVVTISGEESFTFSGVSYGPSNNPGFPNDIYLNTRGGITMEENCEMQIIKNRIRDNLFGGIHTGKDQIADGAGFTGDPGGAVLTIRQNKVYGNGNPVATHGGGIDVRHASGTIYNNLVYENHRGGIRFGDYITEIINNTVADNGQSGLGGGIIYDDLAGAVNDPPEGTPPAALDIRNNICAYNQKAGMKACFTNTPGSEERDYNLLYSNNGTGTTDCGWGTGSYVRRCVEKNYGGCGLTVSLPWTMLDPNDILAAPQFENRAADDYRIQSGSPAVDAGDTSYGTDVSIPPGVGTLIIDMGAYGGPYGIDW